MNDHTDTKRLSDLMAAADGAELHPAEAARADVKKSRRWKLLAASAAVIAIVGGGAFLVQSNGGPVAASAQAAPAAVPVSVASVERRDVAVWDEFAGRLEAVERVEVRPRVAGTVLSVHFREGALVRQGDLLVTIDPAPYAAEVERAEAQVVAAEARVSLAKGELERGEQLWSTRNVSQRDLDQRVNAHREAQGNLRSAQAGVTSAKLNLTYTEVRAPVAGRVGRSEITVGNQIAAGPGVSYLTTLVSVNPIYASFNADEQVVIKALKSLSVSGDAYAQIERIPVQMGTGMNDGTPITGKLQLVDNQVDAKSGTIRVRAVFDNADGGLIPGQFARLRLGQAKSVPALLVNDRAVGTDQDKKFVLRVGADNKVEYREVTLGVSADGLRTVSNGLDAGDKIVVSGLHLVRPGAVIQPTPVQMNLKPIAQSSPAPSDVAQR
ncbi:MAG: efflux transporter periplasmic adaptor subunit [Xanthobacteraceae bacterium]|nr:efflux transporter periplasmic adaptor subunit [Xanthobacteraceae bacterium]